MTLRLFSYDGKNETIKDVCNVACTSLSLSYFVGSPDSGHIETIYFSKDYKHGLADFLVY